jgi:diguanylate cyclase (GGDEF)-like protein/PAS domain S-box-containing protein
VAAVDNRTVNAPLSRALPALAGSIIPGGAAEDLLRALTEHTPVGIFLSDVNGSCRFVNRRWCELSGLSIAEALDDGWMAALHPDDRTRVTAEWAQAAADERDSIVSYRFLRRDGSEIWIDGYASAFHDAEGRHVGWVGACLDITSHRDAEQELRTQAQTDPLTGLTNRRGLEDALLAVTKRGPHGASPPALILIDVDHFKTINDCFGHPAGDQVLVRVAAALRERLRSDDLVARLGGDEFAVLANTHAPERLAEALLAAIRQLSFEFDGTIVGVTGSVGYACLTGHADGDLLAAADRALYSAKQRGRDRFACDPTTTAACAA